MRRTTTFKTLQADDLAIAHRSAIEPEKVGQIWAEHYPSRGIDLISNQICSLICLVLRQRAVLEAGGNIAASLARVIRAAGIPLEQFSEYEAEVKQP
jgi:hypothetical protein